MQPSRDLSRLLEIMAALRDPKTGCPWDLEQDFSTIRHCTIEEAYEVADAIERADFDDLCDELGDLLLQPVYHAQLASERKLFDFGDVVEGITRKLIRRHPHVFGDQAAQGAAGAKLRWEAVKAEERQAKVDKLSADHVSGAPAPATISVLDDVPRPLPALARAAKLDKRAASVGFDWPNVASVLDKCREELDEVQDAAGSGNSSRIAEEIGDVLFAVASLARHLGVDPEAALSDANGKFIRRFKYVETRCRDDGLTLESAGMERLDAYWNDVRKADSQAASGARK